MPQAARINITPSLPRALPPAARAKVHSAIEAHLSAVEALTAFLDEADGDVNLEPSLGSSSEGWAPERFDQEFWAQGSGDEREHADDSDECAEEDLRVCL